MTQGERTGRGARVCVLLVNDAGEVLGSESYSGEPVVAVRWSADPREVNRRVEAALEAQKRAGGG